MSKAHSIRIIDSHTAGEPTRVVLEGGPELGTGPLSERIDRWRATQDRFRTAVINEPRGSDALVGALLVEPHDRSCVAGIIFFNNVSYLGMCGHGTIGVVATLAHMGRIRPGVHRFDTCAGTVTAVLSEDGSVAVDNVPSYRKAQGVACTVPGIGTVTGDVAWGGNWFYLIERHEQLLTLENREHLVDYTWRVRRAVNEQGFPEVDHVELFGAAHDPSAQSRNFVLCPGKAYDRSPCGTGTSAKLACLAADGKLTEDQVWTQESIVGSTFTATYKWLDRAAGRITPTIRGRAYITSEARLHLDPGDPFQWGFNT